MPNSSLPAVPEAKTDPPSLPTKVHLKSSLGRLAQGAWASLRTQRFCRDGILLLQSYDLCLNLLDNPKCIWDVHNLNDEFWLHLKYHSENL